MKKPKGACRGVAAERKAVLYQAADLAAFEQDARSLGILLEGGQNPHGPGFIINARRYDTGASLSLSFRVSADMSSHHEQFMVAMRGLLAEALALLEKE